MPWDGTIDVLATQPLRNTLRASLILDFTPVAKPIEVCIKGSNSDPLTIDNVKNSLNHKTGRFKQETSLTENIHHSHVSEHGFRFQDQEWHP